MAGLYIHIPFCLKKCEYCDFVSFADHSQKSDYVAALKKELSLAAQKHPDVTVQTVFMGGGTPSVLPLGSVEEILNAAASCFDIAADAEVTLECNPGTIDGEKLREYRASGVNRLSMGMQSANDALLRRIGRVHDTAEFIAAYRLARKSGFTNINADIMYGLPGQSTWDYLDAIDLLAQLGADHISAYSLILEEGTPLYRAVREKRETLPDEDAVYDMHRAGMRILEWFGYARYEISNYARNEKKCRHNLNYWDNGEYLGIGLNAHSAMHVNGRWMRWANTADLGEYLSRIRANALPVLEEQGIGREDEMFECVMLGLRKTVGMSLAAFEKRFGISAAIRYERQISQLRERGWLCLGKDRMWLNSAGLDMQNQALLAFME